MKKISQVAERLNVSLSTAYALVETGALSSVAVGTRKGLRVLESDLEAFIASRRVHKGKDVRWPATTKPVKLKHLR